MKNINHYMGLHYRTAVFFEDGQYFAEIEDLPGCMADGETVSQALENLEIAKRLWIESRMEAEQEIAEPRPGPATRQYIPVVRIPPNNSE
jgi:antitoxin HicB